MVCLGFHLRLYFVLVLQEKFLRERVLLLHYPPDLFVHLPVRLVGVWLLEALLSAHGSRAYEADILRHAIGLHKAVGDLRHFVDIIGGSCGDTVVEYFL